MLLNPGTLCYAHATFLALAWLLDRWLASQAPASSVSRLLAKLRHRPRERGPLALRHQREWGEVTRRWGPLRLQHDAAEFLLHVLGLAADFPVFSPWRTLSGEGMLPAGDHGCNIISLDLVNTAGAHLHSLQDCITAWHELQLHQHVLCDAGFVVFQLKRFSRNAFIRKDTSEIVLSSRVLMPCVCTPPERPWEQQVQWLEFELISCVMHVGASPQAGHYQAVLYDTSGEGYLTDDGRPARIAVAADSISKRCYLLFLRKCGLGA